MSGSMPRFLGTRNRMDSDIDNWVAKCERWNLAKMPHFQVRSPMHSIVARESIEVMAIDFPVH